MTSLVIGTKQTYNTHTKTKNNSRIQKPLLWYQLAKGFQPKTLNIKVSASILESQSDSGELRSYLCSLLGRQSKMSKQ